MNLRDILRQAGFRGQALNTAYAIAMAESGGNARAFNGNRKTGDQSYGLFQINMLGGMGPERRRQFGLSANDDLFDAVRNAQIAYKMSKGGTDWSPWSTYKRGDYRKYLGGNSELSGAAAGAAVGAATGSGTPLDAIGNHQATLDQSTRDIIHTPVAPGFAQEIRDFARNGQDFKPGLDQTSRDMIGQGRAAGASATALRDKAIAAAMSQLGVAYSWGGGSVKGPTEGFGKGAGIRGFDCSSLLMYAYGQAGYSIPRTGRPQLALGKRVPLSELVPGDFLGWGDGHHIAMYIGNGQYIQAPSTGGHVEIKSLKGTSAWGVHLNLPGD